MDDKLQRPQWLNKKIVLKDCSKVRTMLSGLGLSTVCQEADCPNISECFSRNEATFLILGRVCTRNCRFCGVGKGSPAAVDIDEPEHIAEAVRRLNLRHVVITSVTRDDLPDGGADGFAKTISAIRNKLKGVTIEVLIPDIKGDEEALRKVVEAGPEVIGHNVETVPRMYEQIRQMADYRLSLNVLSIVKDLSKGRRIFTKSALMLGLGEREDEVLEVLHDLRDVGTDFVCIGQYLCPSSSHYPVQDYIRPEKFDFYKREALRLGFRYVASGPYVRSSYLAREALL